MLRKLLGALALVLGLAALPTASASAAPTPAPAEFFGTNIQSLIRDGSIQPQRWPLFLDMATDSGLPVARFDASWALAEPDAPVQGVHAYNWAYLDSVAAALANAGQRWLPVLGLPPGWAQVRGNALPDKSIPGFVAFATAFAQRYGQGGDFWRGHPALVHAPITQLEVWTEANSTNFWSGNPDPAKYLSVFTKVRDAMKAVDPSLQILVSLGWQDYQTFTNALYAAGLAGDSDGIGFHPYAPTAGGIVTLTRGLRQLLAAHGEQDLPIFMTEIGQPTNAPGRTPFTTAYAGPVSDAARGASASLAADALARSDCNLKGYDWYSLVEPQRNPNDLVDWLGLVNANGTPTETLWALHASASRWASPAGQALRAGKAPLMSLCNGPDGRTTVASDTMAPNNKLPLEFKVPLPVTGPCPTFKLGYYGNPLEDASVFVRNYKGRQKGIVTKADGLATVCLGTNAPKRPFLTWARSGAIANSQLYSCRSTTCAPVFCRNASIKAKVGTHTAKVLRLRLALKCGRRVLYGEPLRITGIGPNGTRHLLKTLWSPTKTTILKLPWKAKWKLTSVNVKFAGDKSFQLKSRVRGLKIRPGSGG